MPALRAPSSWTMFRRVWALTLLAEWTWHRSDLVATRSTAGLAFPPSVAWLAALGTPTPNAVWALWWTVMVGAMLAVVSTGWLQRLAVAAAGISALVLGLEEALNLKAYDRLIAWQSLALVFAPGHVDGDDDERPSTAAGFARWALVIAYAGLYGSTGWMKLLFEPAWATGKTLEYVLVDTSFGLRPLGVLASAHRWMLAPAGWLTIAFETSFPFLVTWKRARGPLLVAGVALHLGIFALMTVGPFSVAALAGYPVLLGESRWKAVVAWVRTRRLHVPLAVGLATWAVLIALPLASPWALPSTPAPFTVPDPSLRSAIAAALLAPAAHPVVPGAGTRRALTAPATPKTAGQRGAVAVLAALAEAGYPNVALTDAPGPDAIHLTSLGRMSLVPGTQRWPGAWGLFLPSTSDFVALDGAAVALLPCFSAAGVNVTDTSTVLGHGPSAVTDTGPLRLPALATGAPDPALLDLDTLARVAKALQSCPW